MKFLFIVLLWLICPLVNAGATSSQNIIVLKESSPIQTNKGLIWRDESENATIDQVIKRLDEFKPVSELLNSKNENKSGTYWALATFKNELNHDYLMRFASSDTDSSIYIIEPDGKITSVKKQLKRKYNEFADINPEIVQEVNSVSKFTVAYISKGNQTKILSKHIDLTIITENDFPIGYWDHAKFLEWSRFNIYFQGILLGIFVAFFCFSAYYTYTNKDLASLIYGLWLILVIICILNVPYGGDRLSEFFINNEKLQFSNLLINFFESNLSYLLNLIFLIFGMVSLNLKKNLPRFFKFLAIALIYLFIVDIATTLIDFLESDLQKYLPLYHRYFSRLPTAITHFVFIISALIMMHRGVRLALPLFLADILNSSTLLVPYLSTLANLTNISASIFNIYSEFFDYVCFSVQSLIMASSIVSRIKSMQDQLNLKEKSHREFVENQNKVLEETVAERTKDLNLEMQKSERLMLNILPQSIATRLKAGDEGISDSYQNATILFSDLVGFTKMSSSKTAEELVFLLNDLFKRFDTRATSLGLEKIKTIGDAYMVAGGLPTNDDEHAIRVTKMALGMYEDLDAFNKEHGMELDMRIGINSGPVVAGVIGHSKFSYDLWGNTVNTASRMESTCLPGKVQVSPSTYEQIKGHFDVQENQVIECKGLGQIMTYFVK